MHRLLTVLLLTSIGCDKFEMEDTGSGGNGTPTPGGGSDLPTENGLPDWSWELDQSGCDIQQATGIAGPGATTYFYGMYTRNGGGFNGYEEWHLFANETWSDDGGYDCIIKWSVTAVEGEAGPCAACDLNLAVALTVNEAESTCPENLISDASVSSSARYDILRTDDGASQWFFGGNGEQFGTGAWNTDHMNFITPKSCRWF